MPSIVQKNTCKYSRQRESVNENKNPFKKLYEYDKYRSNRTILQPFKKTCKTYIKLSKSRPPVIPPFKKKCYTWSKTQKENQLKFYVITHFFLIISATLASCFYHTSIVSDFVREITQFKKALIHYEWRNFPIPRLDYSTLKIVPVI